MSQLKNHFWILLKINKKYRNIYCLYIYIKLKSNITIIMKTNSIKIITLAAKKIMLQKKILKYQELIKDIDEAIEHDINYKSNFEDFEILFKKLVFDFKHLLNDDEDMQSGNNNNIQAESNNNNDEDMQIDNNNNNIQAESNNNNNI